MKKAFKLEIDNDLAILTFDLKDEKVNILSGVVLKELDKILDSLKKKSGLKKLLIVSAKKTNFIAGANIDEIRDINSKADALKKVKLGQDIFNKLENLPLITICYINGSCMGGGTELALACDFRIANQDIKIALPEVNLGIIPGFGGTQRLPRLVGLLNSLPIILTGKPVNYKKAYKIGLIDDYFPVGYEKRKICEFVTKIDDKAFRSKLKRKRAKRKIIEKFGTGRTIILQKAKQNVLKKTKGRFPAPLTALKVIEKTYPISLKKGLAIELKYFSELVVTDICKNLIGLFRISEEIKKDPGASGQEKPIQIKNAGVLGAGVMGGGIAWGYTKVGARVRMKDMSWQGIALGYKQIGDIYNFLLKTRKKTKTEVTNKLALVTATIDNSGFKSCDIVSEAIIEDVKIKKKAFKDFEKYVSPKTIIASNTSSIPISEMAKSLKKPERFIGMHFFNPVNRMPLVEVIPGAKTNQQTIKSVVALAKKMGKTPIVVKDRPGFLVNRILLTYINEAFSILDECGNIEAIDRIATKFGLPMGPFTLADTVGLDVGFKVAKILEEEFGTRMKVSPLIDLLYNKEKLLGKKSGKGLYIYEGKEKRHNYEVTKLCGLKNQKITKEEIIDRLILVMVNEAARCLDEKIVKSAGYLDMAMIMGTGFPADLGGLLKYADKRGIKNINQRLRELAKIHGEKFKPCKYLLELEKNKKEFYS